jgi:O-antigen/teichoic acid export membrane protein
VAGRIHTAVRLELVTAILTAFTLAVLTPRYGAYGAAIGFSAHSVIYSVIAAVYFLRQRPVFFGVAEVA